MASNRRRGPANISLLHLPPYSPALNPVDNIRQFLRQNHLSNKVYADHHAIVDARCAACNTLMARPDRTRSIASREWAITVKAHGAQYYVAARISADRIDAVVDGDRSFQDAPDIPGELAGLPPGLADRLR